MCGKYGIIIRYKIDNQTDGGNAMSENRENEIKKKEDAELREYEVKSLITRAAVSLATLIISGAAGYITGRLRKK